MRAWAEEGWAYVAVRDTGRGIDRQNIDHIFDMFVRGRATRPGEGLGVGLALPRRIAEIHGGTLTAHSEGENRGSEFILRVPLVDAPEAWEAARTVAAPATEVRPLVPRRVLQGGRKRNVKRGFSQMAPVVQLYFPSSFTSEALADERAAPAG